MNKKLQNKEFEKMSNEELCAIAAKLKFQLVEARFKMSSGELEKPSIINEIRKTIAKIFTELTNRGFKVSIGSHGVTMYDLKNKMKPMSIDPKKLNELMKKDLKEKKDKKKTADQNEKTKTAEKPKATIKEKTKENTKEGK